MVVDLTGVVHNVVMGLATNVFGSVTLTVSVLMIMLLVFAILIQIPLPFALALNIPFAIVFTAFGYLPLVVGGLMVVGFLTLAVFSMLAGLGNK